MKTLQLLLLPALYPYLPEETPNGAGEDEKLERPVESSAEGPGDDPLRGGASTLPTGNGSTQAR